jgi:hypothetical protein
VITDRGPQAAGYLPVTNVTEVYLVGLNDQKICHDGYAQFMSIACHPDRTDQADQTDRRVVFRRRFPNGGVVSVTIARNYLLSLA